LFIGALRFSIFKGFTAQINGKRHASPGVALWVKLDELLAAAECHTHRGERSKLRRGRALHESEAGEDRKSQFEQLATNEAAE